MTINLYYIEGISRIDTPYFATKTSQASLSKQEEFFNNHIVQSVELGFYPPHYRNVIKFDDEDLVLDDNVNYLSLEYNDKRYYYFIDSINYVSESIIELEITMDVIQTYMFDIYISNGIIERKFINRYVTGMINRDYIRENVSDGEYEYYTHSVVNEDVRQWLVFVPTTKYYNLSPANVKVEYSLNLPGFGSHKNLISAYPFYILPFYESVYSGDTYEESANGSINTGTSVSDKEVDAQYSFAYYSGRNWVVDAYICPFNCSDDLVLTYDRLNDNNIVSFADTKALFIIHHDFNVVGNINQNFYTITVGTKLGAPTTIGYDNYIGKFTSYVRKSTFTLFNSPYNMAVGVAYNSKYITQMYDENYIRYTFGSLANYTSIPLYRQKHHNVDAYYAFNPTDGTRLYWVCHYQSTNDTYNTVVLDNNVIHFDLKNDPWAQYQSANRMRWVSAVANTALTVFTKGMSNLVANKFSNQDIMSVMSNPNSYDKRYNLPKLKTKPAKLVQSAQRDIETRNVDTALTGGSAFGNNIIGQFIKDENVKTMPPTPRQINNLSSVCAKQAYIMHYVEHVRDYEQCAQYYHRNGFLVHEYINAVSDIFAYVFSRYYFNILKMSVPNVHLHHVIEDDETCDAIKDRLIDGVRLWNINNTGVVIGDFSKDNVENAFIS